MSDGNAYAADESFASLHAPKEHVKKFAENSCGTCWVKIHHEFSASGGMVTRKLDTDESLDPAGIVSIVSTDLVGMLLDKFKPRSMLPFGLTVMLALFFMVLDPTALTICSIVQ